MAAPSSEATPKKDRKYLLTLVNARTLERVWIIHLTRTWAIVVTGLGVITMLAIFSCLILFTPLRSLLPKNTEEFREELVHQALRVDSLQTVIDVQTEYLNSLRCVMAGTMSTDTIPPLDSLQVITQERLMEARRQVTEDFLAEHELLDSLKCMDLDEGGAWQD